jgi:hypothetical protein
MAVPVQMLARHRDHTGVDSVAPGNPPRPDRDDPIATNADVSHPIQ